MTSIINRQEVFDKINKAKVQKVFYTRLTKGPDKILALFEHLGPETILPFIVGNLGFKPKGSKYWQASHWQDFLDSYEYDVAKVVSGTDVLVRKFIKVYFKNQAYFNQLEQQWYV